MNERTRKQQQQLNDLETRHQEGLEKDLDDLLRFHRRAHIASMTGIALASAGIATLAGTLVIAIPNLTATSAIALGIGLGAVASIIGVVLVAVASLAIRGQALDEAWFLGFDRGFERGVKETRTIVNEILKDNQQRKGEPGVDQEDDA